MSSVYTEKWVLFLDILGFEAIINDKEDEYKKSEEFANIVLPIFKEMTRFVKVLSGVFDLDNRRHKGKFIEVSQFSDTFVISSISLAEITQSAEVIQTILLEKSIISRGAITYGKVFHNGSQFIGPAITRAYNLEKSEALYPRVIIDPDCEQHSSVRSLFVANTYSANILKDYDGYLYINYLTQFRKFDNIENLYEQYKNTPHRGKYMWLKNKADEFVQNKK